MTKTLETSKASQPTTDWLRQLPRWLVWTLVSPLIALNLWLLSLVFHQFQSLLTTLTVAALLAFLLDYPIRYLQQRGLKRALAILGIAGVVLLAVGLFVFTLSPVLVRQLKELATRLPTWIESSSQQIEAVDSWLLAQQIPLDLTSLAAKVKSVLPTELTMLPNQVLSSFLSLADRIIEVLLTAVLTLYFLLYGKDFWAGLLEWVPQQAGSRIKQAARQQFQNYFVGQATIAALMATLLSCSFYLLKIPFWLVYGLGIGVMVLIPFGDFLGMLVVTLLVSLQNVWLGAEVLAIALITDQIIDNAVAPRLIGDLVGLNPIWVVIVLLVGAQLGGVIGLLIAVPLAGTVKSLASSYKKASKENALSTS